MKSKIHKHRKNNKFIVCKKFLITAVLFFAVGKITAQNGSTITTTEELPNWPAMLANLPTAQISSVVLLDSS
jgi:heme/copper-type cytochrome/quinol oxidase subunit 3